MNPRYPIYIISKGRSKRCLTARELTKMNVPFFLVVEPQEENEYRTEWPNAKIITTPFSNLNQGLYDKSNDIYQ